MGKTYGFKKYAIKDFIKNKCQFVYVRRYKEELSDVSKFFNDIREEFPNVKLEVKGNVFSIDGEVAGYAIALSTSKIKKSVPYPRVNKICFDEFILDKGVYNYLPDEVVYLLELYETIARMRDVKMIFLSNAISITNPYFLFFNIGLPYGKNIMRKGDILIEYVEAEEFTEKKKETRFAKVIEGTAYASYAIENKYLRDNKNFIQKKTPNSNFYFTFIYKGKNYGVWVDYKAGVMTVSEDYDSSCKLVYAITNEDHKPNTLLLKGIKKGVYFKSFVEQYKLGNVRFENMNVKNICQEVIKMSF